MTKESQALARELVQRKEGATGADTRLVVAELQRLPKGILRELKEQGTVFWVLRGITGKLPGAFSDEANEAIIETWDRPGGGRMLAGPGAKLEGGRVVAAANMVLYIAGLAYDSRGQADRSLMRHNDPAFIFAREADLLALNAFDGDVRQTYAASFMYFFCGHALARKTRPHLTAYWEEIRARSS